KNYFDRIKFQFLRGESSAPFEGFAGLLRGRGAALWASVTQHLYVICNVSKLILQSARSTPAHISVFSLILASVAGNALANPPIAVADWLPARVDQWKPIGVVAVATPVPYPVPFNSSTACPPGNPIGEELAPS